MYCLYYFLLSFLIGLLDQNFTTLNRKKIFDIISKRIHMILALVGTTHKNNLVHIPYFIAIVIIFRYMVFSISCGCDVSCQVVGVKLFPLFIILEFL
jgi:hypothetical protein